MNFQLSVLKNDNNLIIEQLVGNKELFNIRILFYPGYALNFFY